MELGSGPEAKKYTCSLTNEPEWKAARETLREGRG